LSDVDIHTRRQSAEQSRVVTFSSGAVTRSDQFVDLLVRWSVVPASGRGRDGLQQFAPLVAGLRPA
jgi:hypothetical protein